MPERLIGKKIKEVKIIPLYKGRAFKIAYCCENDEENLKLNRENSLAIDIGLDNLALFGALRRQLKTFCERHGMNFVEQEESFTSKASFLDLNEIPTYDAETPYTGSFSGKRIKRGLYRSKSGKLINADVNGAANILRKSKQNLNFERLCVGLLDRPLRIRVA